MAVTRSTHRPPQSSQKSKTRQRPPKTQPTEIVDTKGAIKNLLKEKGALTRGDITTLTGIPRTTVYDTLMNMLLSGIVEKYVERNGRRGRPSVFYQLA